MILLEYILANHVQFREVSKLNKAQQFIDSWLRHRLVTLEILQSLTDQNLSFQPWDKALSLNQLVVHMLVSANMFAETARTGSFSRPDMSTVPQPQSITELREIAKEWTEKTKQNIAPLSDDDFQNIIDVSAIFGSPVPASVILGAMRDHEIHHKGQLFVYARMVGVEKMPNFIQAKLP